MVSLMLSSQYQEFVGARYSHFIHILLAKICKVYNSKRDCTAGILFSLCCIAHTHNELKRHLPWQSKHLKQVKAIKIPTRHLWEGLEHSSAGVNVTAPNRIQNEVLDCSKYPCVQ